MHRIAPLLVIVILAACGDGTGDGNGASGIRGRALAGPQCPVEMAESPCPDLPWEGTVVATQTDSGETFTTSTDADGRFDLSLAPGTYEVTIDAASTPPTAELQTVTVEEGSFTEIEVFVDTGIR
ncbi:MAG: carboxypeptidase-like regulatory domain-containing protein [Actinomycetota bacterium]